MHPTNDGTPETVATIFIINALALSAALAPHFYTRFALVGEIMRPVYTTFIYEHSIITTIEGMKSTLSSRKYDCKDKVSYASEEELTLEVTYADLRLVTLAVKTTVGFETSMKRHIDSAYMAVVKYTDHDVLDVGDIGLYRGMAMLKADGMQM